MNTVIPASLVCIPVILDRNARMNEFALMASSLMNTIPICNSLVVILVIPRFRRLAWCIVRNPLEFRNKIMVDSSNMAADKHHSSEVPSHPRTHTTSNYI